MAKFPASQILITALQVQGMVERLVRLGMKEERAREVVSSAYPEWASYLMKGH